MKTLFRPLLLVLGLTAAVGCATPAADEEMGSTDSAIVGSVREVGLERVRDAYRAAKIEDFTDVAPFFDTTGWKEIWHASDFHSFQLTIDGHPFYVLDFVSDAKSMAYAQFPIAPAGDDAAESFVLIFEKIGNAEPHAILLYRADKDKFISLSRALRD